MSADKQLQAWKNHVPPDVPLEDALLVARENFENVNSPTRGSHYKISDSRLKRAWEMNPDVLKDCPWGCWDLPAVKGRRVKGFYIKRMLELIQIIDFMVEKGY